MMVELLGAFGRGIVKMLISLFVGGGVGLLTFGITTKDKPEIWEQFRQGPNGEFFLALGAGLLTAGGMMLIMFLLPRRRNDLAGAEKGLPYSELPR